MKDLGRRGLALLLTLLMVVSLVPAAFAEEADVESASEEIAAVETVAEETAEETPAEVPEEAPAEEPAAEETAAEETAATEEETVTNDAAETVDAPTNITAVNALDGVKINWNTPTGSISYYLISRKVKGQDDTQWQNIATVTASSSEYTDDSVENDVEYCYTVGVQETGGSSNYNYKNFCTVRAVTAPTNIKAANVTSGVIVSWDSMSNADCYIVYRRADGTAAGAWTQITEVPAGTTSYTDTDASLVSGNAYYYTVRTVRATTGEYGIYASEGVRITYFGVPKVTNAENGENGVVVTYTGVSNATEYRIYRRLSTSSTWVLVGTSTNLTSTDSSASLTSGQTYYYTVAAYDHNTDTESVKSEPGYGPLTYLAMPQLATPTCNETSVTLTWAAVTGAESYNIYRREDGGTFGFIANKQTATTCVDQNLTAGKIYYYTVEAVKGSTVSAKSPVGSLGLALPTPVISMLTNDTDGIHIQWNRIEGIDNYYIYRSTDGGTTYSKIGSTNCTSGTVASYTDTKVSNGTTYYYAVQSVYLSGITSNDRMGKLSTWKEITRIGSAAMISAANSQSGITVTWNSVTGASKYNVYRMTVGSGTANWVAVGSTTSTSITDPDTNLAYGSTYRYTVAAVKGTTEGVYGVDYKTVTRLKTVEFSVKNTSSGIKLSWKTVAGADYYNVYRKTADTGWKKVANNVTDLYWEDAASGLTNGATYIYTVRAVNSTTSSLSWYETSGKSMIWYSAPTLTKCTNVKNGVYVSWSAPTNVTPSSYTVYRKINDGHWVKLADVTGTSYTDTDVSNNNKYTYTVQAHVNGTDGTWDTTGLSTIFVSTPILVSAANTSAPAAGNSKVKFTWTAVEGAAEYRVYRKINGGSWAYMVTTTETYWEDTGVNVGTTYCYTVRAVQYDTSVSPSIMYLSSYDGTGKTVLCLATPTIYSAIGDSNGITVRWASCGGASGYRIYRKTATTGWYKIGETSNCYYYDNTVDAGVAYTYTVRAENGDYLGYYDTTGRTGMRLTVPSLISAANAIQSTTSGVQVTWNRVDGAQYYYVYRKENGTGWKRVNTDPIAYTETSYFDSSVVIGTTYTYTVRASYTSADGKMSMSGYDSNGVTVTYNMTPTGWYETTSSSITVNWNALSNATSYYVYRKLPGGSWKRLAQVSSTTTSYKDTTMALNTYYEYTVRAEYNGTLSGYESFGAVCTG